MKKEIKQPKISVIVPVYNTSKFLDKCLESLLNQTYKNLEIIVVEDCSTDNSREVLEKYNKEKNIKIVYNEKNSGLSFTRNNGLKHATGDYIGYIDSDDYVDLDYYEKLMNSILENDSEIAICDMQIVYAETKAEQLSKCCDSSEFNLINVVNNGLAASACNKLFLRSLIEKYPFEVGKINEDIAVVIPTLANAKKISYADTKYYYVQREKSVQNSSFSEKRFDIFHAVDLTLERIKNNKQYEELKDAIVFNQLVMLFLYVIPKEKNKKKRKHILREYNERIEKYNVLSNKYYLEFIKNSGKKHSIYYKTLFKLNWNKHYFLANQLISVYDILAKILKKKLINFDEINLANIIKKAEIQNKMPDEKIKISVIVPNYNYSRFLYQRIYSILNQTYKIYELIILDDCSKDDSRKTIDEIVKNINKFIKVKKIYNTKNSGSAFKQWKKGFDEAEGDYIWIAEADDYCDNNLISNLAKPIEKEKDVVISYADTAFIDVFGNILLKSIKPEIDIQKSGHWDKSYINNGLDEIKNYSYLNCTIANVSSALIKKGDYSKFLEESGNYKQAGDWLFYVNVMAHGKIAYTNKVLNYYRMHGDNVSSTMNYQRHLDEIKKIHLYYIRKFNLTKTHKEMMRKRIEFLEKVWKLK